MGTVPGMLLTVPYTAVQFVALQQCKDTAAKMGWEGRRNQLNGQLQHVAANPDFG